MHKYIKPPYIARLLTRKSVFWRIPTKNKVIYLTFDDGPIPDLTPQIISILNRYNVKATFFCVGENIKKYPSVFQLIKENHHDVGNHTYNHLNGWKTKNNDYIKNFNKAEAEYKTSLFRPPYGKIRPKQLSFIAKTHRIILWSVLTYDFSPSVNGEECLKIAVDNLYNGAIIVFHDNIKAADTMLYTLPRFIEYALNQGYIFGLISRDTTIHTKSNSLIEKMMSKITIRTE